MIIRTGVVGVFCFLAVGCAHPFTHIQPGMNSTEVRGATGSAAPTNVISFGASQAWFYGKERCILFVDDKVVAKWSDEGAPKGTTPEAICRAPDAPDAAPPSPVTIPTR